MSSCSLVPDSGLAFVDLETTGGPSQRASITEIGIVEVDADGVREWSSLVRPEMRIPTHIERLTGIRNDMVADAPRFEDLAQDVFDRLEGRLFVAHNARFDHSHLKAAFRRAGVDIRPRVLCTVKLSRRLFPEEARHGLDHLIARHGLSVSARHRALGDAQLLWQFWQRICERFPPGLITETVRELTSRPALPPGIDAATIDAVPDAPGVYLFYGEGELPLYIGKSGRLRTRVLSHFAADHRSERELRLSQQMQRIEWIPTDGEISALLLEAQLIKARQPAFNRQLRRNRDLCTWRLGTDLLGDGRLELVRAADLEPGCGDALFGFFRSRSEAQRRLREIAREQALCPPLLGLEKPAPGGRCFNHQLHRCHGACIGDEAPAAHTQRLLDALSALRIEAWPFDGPVALREGSTLHVVDGWRYLGAARSEAELDAVRSNGRAEFDLDLYRILHRALDTLEVVPLPVP